jgi:hypothetical protein
MYSEELHYYVHNKTNATQTREGRARILIRMKIIIIPPRKMQGREDRAIVLGASMPLFPRHRHHCFPVPVIVVVSATSPRQPGPSCSPFPLVLVMLPISTPWAVARGGSWGWCQLVPALHRPVVHPVSRGSQQQWGRRVPSCVSSAGGAAMWQGVLTLWLSHFPGLPDSSYVASHLIFTEEGMGGLGQPLLSKSCSNLKKSKGAVSRITTKSLKEKLNYNVWRLPDLQN